MHSIILDTDYIMNAQIVLCEQYFSSNETIKQANSKVGLLFIFL